MQMVSPGSKQIDPGATRGGWRQNDWKIKHNKQGTPATSQPNSRTESSTSQSAKRSRCQSPQEVRVPVRAMKRLIPAEQRGTGRLIERGQAIGKETRLNVNSEQSRGT